MRHTCDFTALPPDRTGPEALTYCPGEEHWRLERDGRPLVRACIFHEPEIRATAEGWSTYDGPVELRLVGEAFQLSPADDLLEPACVG